MKKKLSIVSAITLTLILLSTVVSASSGQATGPEVNQAQDAEQDLSDRGGGPQPLALQNAIRHESGSWNGVESAIETANPPVSSSQWSWVRAFVQHYSGGHNYFGEFGWEKRYPYTDPRLRLVWQNEGGWHGDLGDPVETGSVHWYKIQNTDGGTEWDFYLDLDSYDSKELSFSATTRVASGGEVSESEIQMGPSDCKWNKYYHDNTWSYYSGREQSDSGYHADLIDTYHWNVWGPDEGETGFTSSTNPGGGNGASWEEKEVTTEAEAISIALQQAKWYHGLGSEPLSVAAGQMTWGEFLELVKEEPSPRRASDSIVWVVSIKGNVVCHNPPTADGTPSHSEYDNMYAVLEANTGILIREGAWNPGYEPEWSF